ncbi:MAG: hypothetical protein CSA20_08485 [Deltaproteobacteria bacterium]|nr:MAG: hypothetical protein CSA20_08485 [Deltaproteobacteria bacterium]
MSDFFGFVGQADAYIDILTDAGVSTGMVLKGNCKAFTPEPHFGTKELIGNGLNNFGQAICSVTIPKPMTATIVFNQLDRDLFALAFFGTSSAAQTSGTMTDKAITAIVGKGVSLGRYLVSDVVVKDSSGATTYNAGDDYTVNTNLGMITVLADGAIGEGDGLLVSCSYAAAGASMEAMTKSNVRIAVKLDGKNYADGKTFVTEIYKMRLASSSDFSLVGSDFVEVTFKGTLETPEGGSTPMKHVWLS